MTKRAKKSWTGWALMGVIAIVAAVFRDSWLPHLKKVPGLKEGVAALEDQAAKTGNA